MARIYDGRLAAVDLTTTQYSILRRLAEATEPVPLIELANELVFERTSLYRALGPLRSQRLVVLRAAQGRAKAVELTALGARKAAAAAPHWQRAQQDFLDAFGVGAWGSLARSLAAVVDASQSMRAAEPLDRLDPRV